MLEGIDGFGDRVGARLGWRPDMRTAALLIGGLSVYSLVVFLAHVGTTVQEATGTFPCVAPPNSTGFHCSVPGWVQATSIVDLFEPIAFLATAAGALLMLLRNRGGRLVVVGGLALLALLQVVVTVIAVGQPVPGQPLSAWWPVLFTAFAILALAAFVLLVPVVPTPAVPVGDGQRVPIA